MQAQKNINLLILSIYRELAEAFIEPAATDQKNELQIGGTRVAFNIFAGDPAQDPTFEEQVLKADAIAIVARFLDVLSLEKLKLIYRHLPNVINFPVALFLLRDKGEIDFKISCPACGQKLWLRDSDVGKRGRCPNCKKPFIILSQADHLKSQLVLPETLPIIKLPRSDNEAFKLAIAQLLDSLSLGIKPVAQETSSEAAKNATMRVQVQDA